MSSQVSVMDLLYKKALDFKSAYNTALNKLFLHPT